MITSRYQDIRKLLTWHFLYILTHFLRLNFTIFTPIRSEQEQAIFASVQNVYKVFLMKIFPFYNTQISLFQFETIDLSENKEQPYLNALKIQKNTVIGSVATPLLGKWFRRI